MEFTFSLWEGGLILISLIRLYTMKTATAFRMGLAGSIIITLNFLLAILLFYNDELKLGIGFYLGVASGIGFIIVLIFIKKFYRIEHFYKTFLNLSKKFT